MSVYNATKAFVISFSEGLRRELKPKVSASRRFAPARCRPNSRRAPASWTCTIRAASTVPPRTSRVRATAGLMRGRGIVVPGAHNKIIPLLPRFLPRAFIATMVYRRLRRWDDA